MHRKQENSMNQLAIQRIHIKEEYKKKLGIIKAYKAINRPLLSKIYYLQCEQNLFVLQTCKIDKDTLRTTRYTINLSANTMKMLVEILIAEFKGSIINRIKKSVRELSFLRNDD